MDNEILGAGSGVLAQSLCNLVDGADAEEASNLLLVEAVALSSTCLRYLQGLLVRGVNANLDLEAARELASVASAGGGVLGDTLQANRVPLRTDEVAQPAIAIARQALEGSVARGALTTEEPVYLIRPGLDIPI